MDVSGGISSVEQHAVRVLLLFMETESGAALLRRLPQERFDVVACRSTQNAPSWLDDLSPDVVLLACAGDPLEIVRTCEAAGSWTDRPVVALCERSDEMLLPRALATGIDEYLTLPMSDQELLARIEALVRRANRNGGSNGLQHVGDLTLSSHEQSVTRDGKKVFLSPIQYRLLSCLVAAPGKVLTHQTLMSRVWGAEYVDSRHYLRLYVRYLREKLEEDPTNPTMILSEWGVGYRFEPPAVGAR